MFGLNDPFAHMNSIMNSFMMDPFGQNRQRQSGQSNNLRNNNNNQMAIRQDPFNPFGHHMLPFERQHNPFSLMHQMMGPNMDSIFSNIHQFPQQMNMDPNAQVYSSSSVISYSNGDGKPKVFQQSKQIHQGPGGVKETREMVRDSERGIEKVAIGHHIGDRAHIIERQKTKSGQVEEIVNLENLDDEEVTEFNQEFENRLANHMRSTHNHNYHHRNHHHLNNNQPLAIEEGGSRSKKDKDRKSKAKSSRHN